MSNVDENWEQLRELQQVLMSMGYTFHVSEKHHTVYKFDEPLFGVHNLTKADPTQALYAHWGAAIGAAAAHAHIYKNTAPAPGPAHD